MTYRIISELDRDENSVVQLVENEEGKRFVRRIMDGKADAYLALKKISHRFLPTVLSAEFDGENTVTIEEYIESIGDLSCLDGEREIAEAFRELCEVLEFIHKQGIIHRDIKPSNVLVANDGHIRLIDFDAARRHKEDASEDTRFLGTKGYAAPEQFGFRQTDFTADIYALGVTMKAVMGELAEKRRYKRIIRRCTEFDPANRYQSADAVERSLRAKKVPAVIGISVAVAAVAAVVGITMSGADSGGYELVSPIDSAAAEITAAPNGHIRDERLQGQWVAVGELDSFDSRKIEDWLSEESGTFTYESTDLNYIDFYYGGTYYAYYLTRSEAGKWSYGIINGDTSYHIYSMNGEEYLFMQKSEGCYILKKKSIEFVSPQDESRVAEVLYGIPETDDYGNVTYHNGLVEEYSFIADSALTGEWVGVDYIDGYDINWLYDKNKSTDDLWYRKIEFREDGSCTYFLGEDSETQENLWTYGLIILDDGRDIRNYYIYCINDEDYLYIEDSYSGYETDIGYHIFKKV